MNKGLRSLQQGNNISKAQLHIAYEINFVKYLKQVYLSKRKQPLNNLKYIPFSGADLKLAACAFHIRFSFPLSLTVYANI